MTKEQAEARRLAVYRKISEIDHWQSTLETLRNYSRGHAVTCVGQNNAVGASYFSGKADGVEELIEKVRTSLRTNPDKDAV